MNTADLSNPTIPLVDRMNFVRAQFQSMRKQRPSLKSRVLAAEAAAGEKRDAAVAAQLTFNL
jgi:hypothetical protein